MLGRFGIDRASSAGPDRDSKQSIVYTTQERDGPPFWRVVKHGYTPR